MAASKVATALAAKQQPPDDPAMSNYRSLPLKAQAAIAAANAAAEAKPQGRPVDIQGTADAITRQLSPAVQGGQSRWGSSEFMGPMGMRVSKPVTTPAGHPLPSSPKPPMVPLMLPPNASYPQAAIDEMMRRSQKYPEGVKPTMPFQAKARNI